MMIESKNITTQVVFDDGKYEVTAIDKPTGCTGKSTKHAYESAATFAALERLIEALSLCAQTRGEAARKQRIESSAPHIPTIETGTQAPALERRAPSEAETQRAVHDLSEGTHAPRRDRLSKVASLPTDDDATPPRAA